jgi:hypothetical protein
VEKGGWMDPVTASVITGLGVAALALLGTLVANRYGWLGKRTDAESLSLTKMWDRISELERQNLECDNNLENERNIRRAQMQSLDNRIIAFRHENSTLGMMVDMLLIECPQADEKVKDMRKRMLERREEMRRSEIEDRALFSGEHKVSFPDDIKDVRKDDPHITQPVSDKNTTIS